MPRKLGCGDRGETTHRDRAAGVSRVSAPTPAKLAPPRLRDIAERERLFSLLDERRKHPLIWIAGPPGAGKTTLVASYLHARKLPGIWYQVDAGDADPATLFYYLRQALPSSRQARLPLLTPEYLPDPPGFARRFFRELFARLPRPATLVLDNFHEASAATSFRAVWGEAAAQIPEGVNLLVIGRQDPPAEYARLQVSELLTVLDAQDLRLTPEETRMIVALRAHLPETAARALHERSKGWAAGLTLLLEHARKTGIPSDAAEQASPQALFNYFATEIYASAADDAKHLWLRTAYLPRFTAQTARVLSGRESADQLLDALHRQGYFVDRRSASGAIYQYHALFQAFLRHRVEQDYPSLERRELICASAKALDAQGDHEAAFSLFAEVADWQAAVGSILAHAAELFGQGRWRTLQGWIDALPRATVETIPWLLFWSGACQTQTEPGAGRATLERAHHLFRTADDELGQALSACAILESHYLEWGDFAHRDRWLGALERILARHPTFPSPAIELRVWSTHLLALAYLRPHHPLAPACAEQVWQLCRLDLPVGERLMAANWLLLYLTMMEDVERMRAAASEFAPLTRSADITPLQRVGWNWSHALHLSCLADFERWRQNLADARSLAATAGLDYLVGVSSLLEIWVFLASGDLGAASERLDELAAEIDRARPNDVALYHFLRSWLALLRERPRTALEHARKSAEIIRERPHAGPSISSLGAYSHALAECGETA